MASFLYFGRSKVGLTSTSAVQENPVSGVKSTSVTFWRFTASRPDSLSAFG